MGKTPKSLSALTKKNNQAVQGKHTGSRVRHKFVDRMLALDRMLASEVLSKKQAIDDNGANPDTAKRARKKCDVHVVDTVQEAADAEQTPSAMLPKLNDNEFVLKGTLCAERGRVLISNSAFFDAALCFREAAKWFCEVKLPMYSEEDQNKLRTLHEDATRCYQQTGEIQGQGELNNHARDHASGWRGASPSSSHVYRRSTRRPFFQAFYSNCAHRWHSICACRHRTCRSQVSLVT